MAPARAALDAGRAIMAKLVALSPENSRWESDLAWFDGAVRITEALTGLNGKEVSSQSEAGTSQRRSRMRLGDLKEAKARGRA
jgi:hypothetical protein